MLNGLSFFHFCHYSCRSVIAAMPSLHELHNLHHATLPIHDLEQLSKFSLSFLASRCHQSLTVILALFQGICSLVFRNAVGVLAVVNVTCQTKVRDAAIGFHTVYMVSLHALGNLTKESHINQTMKVETLSLALTVMQ